MGYVPALTMYGLAMVDEWTKRGFADNTGANIREFAPQAAHPDYAAKIHAALARRSRASPEPPLEPHPQGTALLLRAVPGHRSGPRVRLARATARVPAGGSRRRCPVDSARTRGRDRPRADRQGRPAGGGPCSRQGFRQRRLRRRRLPVRIRRHRIAPPCEGGPQAPEKARQEAVEETPAPGSGLLNPARASRPLPSPSRTAASSPSGWCWDGPSRSTTAASAAISKSPTSWTAQHSTTPPCSRTPASSSPSRPSETGGMTILLAGCGDLGTEAGLRFAAAGHRVVGWRRTPAKLPAEIEGVAADLSTAELPPIPADTTAVVVAVAADSPTEAAYRAAYVDGLSHVLDALERDGVTPRRVLFVSSTAVYGDAGGDWVDESTTPAPGGFSGRILREAEELLEKRLRGTGTAPVSLRLGGIYGPGRTRLIDQVRSGTAVIPDDPRYHQPHSPRRRRARDRAPVHHGRGASTRVCGCRRRSRRTGRRPPLPGSRAGTRGPAVGQCRRSTRRQQTLQQRPTPRHGIFVCLLRLSAKGTATFSPVLVYGIDRRSVALGRA